jgi:hypothetical protein
MLQCRGVQTHDVLLNLLNSCLFSVYHVGTTAFAVRHCTIGDSEIKKTGNVRVNVIQRRVRVTIVAVEKEYV